MLFNSLFFIYWFLPVTLLVYFLVPRQLKNMALLLASFVFYAWGGVTSTLVLAGSVVLNYGMGLAIGRPDGEQARKRMLTAGIVLNLLLLGVFKYTGFAVHNAGVLIRLLGLSPIMVHDVILPLGISFFTFKAITYLVSVKRRESAPQRNFTGLALYLAMFPQLIAGPIDRYRELSGQISQRTVTLEKFSSGISRFALGLFKKVVISSPIAWVADQVFTTPTELLSTPLAWLGAACYALRIYYDFSGYTDMAIGLGRMFGFAFVENFNFPYSSRSVKEFWQRWHISLSTWLRDFLFLPLAWSISGKLKKDRYAGFRSEGIIYLFAAMATFVLCGFWHGPAWHFVAWGTLNGVMLVWERTKPGRWIVRRFRPLAHLYMVFFIVVSMVFFRADTLTEALKFLRVMAGARGVATSWPALRAYFTREFVVMAVVAVLGSTTLFRDTGKWLRAGMVRRGDNGGPLLQAGWSLGTIIAVVLVLFVSTMYLLSQTNTPFIYFHF